MASSQTQNKAELFKSALVSLRKKRAQQTLAKASYLVKDIWDRHLDSLKVIVTPHSPNLSMLLLGPVLTNSDRIQSLYPNVVIDIQDPLAEPDAFQACLKTKTAHYDIILDTFGFHWMNDPLTYLIYIRSILKQNGFYGCGFLGGTTLQELRQAMIQADSDCFGGAYARCSPMIKPEAATRLMQGAGFIDSVVDHEEVLVNYHDFKDLFSDLRAMGESNALKDWSSHLESKSAQTLPFSKSYYEILAATYRTITSHSKSALEKIQITYDIIYMSGWNAGKV